MHIKLCNNSYYLIQASTRCCFEFWDSTSIVDIIYLSRNSENCTLFSVLILRLLEWLPDWDAA